MSGADSGKSRLRLALQVLAAVVVLAMVFVWSEGLWRDKVGPEEGDAHDAGTPYEGPVATVVRREVPVLLEAVGTVRPIREAGVSSRVMGVVRSISVDEGDRVGRDQVLAMLSAPELQARSAAAREAVAAAEAALAQARSDHARIQKLYERQAATEVEWEQAQTALEVARANLERSRSAARGEAAVASYTTLTAPFAGVVVERLKDPGDLAPPGVPVVRVADDSRFRLEAAVEEGQATRIEKGTTVEVRIDPLERSGEARIVEVVPATDPSSRTVLVKAELGDWSGLRSGQFGRLRIPMGSRRAVVVPADAVVSVGGVDLVRVVEPDGRTSLRYVRLGRELGSAGVEVLSGLAEGERLALESGPIGAGDSP